MCKKFAGLFLTVCLTLCSCQGAPPSGWSFDTRRSTPGNHVGAGKFYLDLNENTKVTATNIRSGRKGLFETQFDADSLILEQDKASFDGVLAALDRKIIMQDRYFVGLNDIGDRVLEGVRIFAPIVDTYLQNRHSLAMERALRPTLVQQLAAGVFGGQASLEQLKPLLNQISTSLSEEVAAKVAELSTK